jgi:hypothetical protein
VRKPGKGKKKTQAIKAWKFDDEDFYLDHAKMNFGFSDANKEGKAAWEKHREDPATLRSKK